MTSTTPTGDTRRAGEDGFTLIELMVVVLIIAILLAIAIPTFLGARNAANARAAQSNLRNAVTTEQANFTSTQTFSGDLSAVEPSLKWVGSASALTAGTNSVYAQVQPDPAEVLLMAYANDQNCYALFQSDDPTGSWVSYAAYHSSGGTCAVPTSLPSAPATAPGNGAVAASNASVTWYRSW